jgi:hypothetical protein
LIADGDKQARSLLAFALGPEATRKLRPIAWNRMGESVFAARSRDTARTFSQWLSQLTADSLPSDKCAWIRLGSGLVRTGEQDINSDARIDRAAYLCGVGIGVALLDQGWQAHTRPGMPVLFVRDSERFEPFGCPLTLCRNPTSSRYFRLNRDCAPAATSFATPGGQMGRRNAERRADHPV